MLFGKLTAIRGNQVVVKLDDELNQYKLAKWANGKQPTVQLLMDDGRTISLINARRSLRCSMTWHSTQVTRPLRWKMK